MKLRVANKCFDIVQVYVSIQSSGKTIEHSLALSFMLIRQLPEKKNAWCFTVILKKSGIDSLLAWMYSNG